ncbi:MAG TPA: DinB family protein [Gemmatimonadales bacterium]|nr:DinB family protein [Gemmatimonadales bacterium]
MTVAEVRELFSYNAWANRRIFAALRTLSSEAYFRELKSSHGGLHGTLCHLVWAEQLWLNRWTGKPKPAVHQGKDLATLDTAVRRWEEIERERSTFLDGFPDPRLGAAVVVRPSTGGEFRHTFQEMFRHAVDHSSYHRGQIVTMLRQVGVAPPNTGLIVFYRERGGHATATG